MPTSDFWQSVATSIEDDGPERLDRWWRHWGDDLEDVARQAGLVALHDVAESMTCGCESAQRELMHTLPYEDFIATMKGTIDSLSGLAKRRRLLFDAFEDLTEAALGFLGQAILKALRGMS